MTDWIETKDRLPAKPGNSSYEHVECWIYVKGMILQRPWNCEREVWDDYDGDDFEFHPTEPTHWMQFMPPLPP
ncbi:MAG: DUF551 domain-containing protein [Candidatus Bathyarchaeia archaeon]